VEVVVGDSYQRARVLCPEGAGARVRQRSCAQTSALAGFVGRTAGGESDVVGSSLVTAGDERALSVADVDAIGALVRLAMRRWLR
jgi:cobalamin-dependent methionine synthase I